MVLEEKLDWEVVMFMGVVHADEYLVDGDGDGRLSYPSKSLRQNVIKTIGVNTAKAPSICDNARALEGERRLALPSQNRWVMMEPGSEPLFCDTSVSYVFVSDGLIAGAVVG